MRAPTRLALALGTPAFALLAGTAALVVGSRAVQAEVEHDSGIPWSQTWDPVAVEVLHWWPVPALWCVVVVVVTARTRRRRWLPAAVAAGVVLVRGVIAFADAVGATSGRIDVPDWPGPVSTDPLTWTFAGSFADAVAARESPTVAHVLPGAAMPVVLAGCLLLAGWTARLLPRPAAGPVGRRPKALVALALTLPLGTLVALAFRASMQGASVEAYEASWIVSDTVLPLAVTLVAVLLVAPSDGLGWCVVAGLGLSRALPPGLVWAGGGSGRYLALGGLVAASVALCAAAAAASRALHQLETPRQVPQWDSTAAGPTVVPQDEPDAGSVPERPHADDRARA